MEDPANTMVDFATFSERELPRLVQMELDARRPGQQQGDDNFDASMVADVTLKAHQKVIELYKASIEGRLQSNGTSSEDSSSPASLTNDAESNEARLADMSATGCANIEPNELNDSESWVLTLDPADWAWDAGANIPPLCPPWNSVL